MSREDIEKLLMEQEARIKALMIEKKDEPLKKDRKGKYKEADAVPSAKDLRESINEVINQFAEFNDVEVSEVYTFIYKKLEDKIGISLYKVQKKTSMAPLAFAEKHNFIWEVYDLVYSLLTRKDERGTWICDESALFV